MLSRFIRRQGKNLKKHGPKMLGVASMLGFNPLGMLGKAIGGLGGGSNMFGKFGSFLFGTPGQQIDSAGTMEGGSPGLFQRLGQNMFGLQGDNAAGAGLGLGMNLLGSFGQMNAGYDSDYLRAMNRQLGPLSDAHKNLTQLSQDYLNPNSAMNQQLRDQIRTSNMEGFSDIADRQRNMSLGLFSPESTGMLDNSMMSDAISKALSNQTGLMANQFKTGANLAGSAGTLGAGLGQQRLQNMILAQQKAQQPWQWIGQTGTGLMNRALTS